MKNNETQEFQPNVRFGLKQPVRITKLMDTAYSFQRMHFGKMQGPAKTARIVDGVFCWIVCENDVRPIDLGICVELAIDQLPEFNQGKQVLAHAAHVRALRDRALAAPEPSAEQLQEQRLEARAAFGPGVELVNVFTGKRFTT